MYVNSCVVPFFEMPEMIRLVSDVMFMKTHYNFPWSIV